MSQAIMKNIIITLLLCVGILSVVTGSPFVVNNNEVDNTQLSDLTSCIIHGRAYWCYNIFQAKQCAAVSHCITNVWAPMEQPVDNGGVCKICKEMVKEARGQLLSSDSQDEVRQVLERYCNLIPLKIVAAECRKISDDFLPELVDALKSRMEPEVVCAVLDLCNNVRIDEMLREVKEIEPSKTVAPFGLKDKDSPCAVCDQDIGKAVSYLKAMSREELVNKMFEFCGQLLDGYSSSCLAVVSMLEDKHTIYNYVQKMNPAEMCAVMGFVCEVVPTHPLVSATANVAPTWALLTVVKGEQEILLAAVEDEIILAELRPAEQLNGDDEQESRQLVVYASLESHERLEDENEIDVEFKPDPKRCKLCQTIAVKAQSFIQKHVNSTEKDLAKLVRFYCKEFLKDKTQLQKCYDIVKTYGHAFVHVMIKDLDPDIVCPALNVCPVPTEMDTNERLADNDEMDVEFKPDPKRCKLCQAIAAKAQNFFEKHVNSTEKDLAKLVRFYCKEFLKDQEQLQKCYDIVKTYGHTFVLVMIKDLDPDIVCPAINVCPLPTQMDTDTAVPIGILNY